MPRAEREGRVATACHLCNSDPDDLLHLLGSSAGSASINLVHSFARVLATSGASSSVISFQTVWPPMPSADKYEIPPLIVGSLIPCERNCAIVVAPAPSVLPVAVNCESASSIFSHSRVLT